MWHSVEVAGPAAFCRWVEPRYWPGRRLKSHFYSPDTAGMRGAWVGAGACPVTAPANCTASLSAVRLGEGSVKARRVIPESFR